ncbi:hypothetical protein PENSTE_c020G01120 [Penicillium steckii]|uniref:WD repeat protein n=1 Tax=Penicillium steckii TaxID=303698 RepID=A0A1V6SU64_9EURO|nr:hypothetical protein PENSTE_c020G01120 [Penicillium steckii]
MSELTGMSPSIEQVDVCVPITALKTFDLGQKLFVFQGQGPYFRVIDDQTGDVVAQIQGFKRNNVHGFILLPQHDNRVQVIIWGGPSVRLIEVVFGAVSDEPTSVSAATSELLAPDWILSGCAAVPGGTNAVYLLTANNALLALKLSEGAFGRYKSSICMRQLTSSVKSILYTGDLIAISASHILVVSGTAFGEIIVWSCFINDQTTGDTEAIGSIHHFFTGHEGSIYGVRILPQVQTLKDGQSTRLLASVSDDRTLRIWDISDCERKSVEDRSAYSTDGFELRSTGFGSTATEYSEVGSESCVAKAYGHAARIWAVSPRSTREEIPGKLGLVTRGEDCTCIHWDLEWNSSSAGSTKYQLRQTDSIHPHSGKHIWSMDLCSQGEETVVFTGGADGALKSHRIRESNRPKKPDPPVNLRLAKLHGPKTFALVAPDCVLCCTVRSEIRLGFLGPGEYAEIAWEELCALEDLSSFASMAGSTSLGLALIGNSKGLVRLYNHDTKLVRDLVNLSERALAFFILETSEPSKSFSFIAAHLKDDEATMVTVHDWKTDSPRVETAIIVLPEKPFEISSAAKTHDDQYLILGSKLGGLATYRMSGLSLPSGPLVLNRRAHGKEGTHHIQALPATNGDSNTSSQFIFTCGRDGHYCVHEIKTIGDEHESLSFETLHRTPSALGSHLQGAYFDENTGDLMIYGFKGQTFVLRNESKQTDIDHIPSGGFRRTWTFHPGLNGSRQAILLFQEGAQVLAVRIQTGRNRSVRAGAHGREIKSLDCQPHIEGRPLLFATGAEDTTLRIMSPSNDAGTAPWGSFKTHLILKTHNSGIQQVTWSKNGRYLFTSAADEEFFVWKIGSLASFGVTTVLLATCPKTEQDSELRITSFDMVEVETSGSEEYLVCLTLSNSKIRIFHFTPNEGSYFTQLAEGQYMTNCLTQARFLVKDSSVGLITAATDGYFTMWDLTNTLDPFYAISASELKLKTSLQETEISPESIVCENRFQITSNSIKAMELVQISENVDLLLAGSDDNSVTVSLLRTSPTNGDRTAQVVTVSIPDAHTASVTALQVISHRKTRHTDTGAEVTSLTAVTSGNDHRIKTWSITIDPAQSGTKGIDIDLQSDRYSPVADISSLGLLQNPTESRLLVGGVGLELLRLKFK